MTGLLLELRELYTRTGQTVFTIFCFQKMFKMTKLVPQCFILPIEHYYSGIFFIPVSSLKVLGHSIHSERKRIYQGKSVQALQNDTIIISWLFSFRVIQATVYSALSPVFSTNVVCVKTQQKYASIKHHDIPKQ